MPEKSELITAEAYNKYSTLLRESLMELDLLTQRRV